MYVLHPLVLTVCVINSKYMNVFFDLCKEAHSYSMFCSFLVTKV